ncbi:MAG: DUF1080 domain-containing protein [Gemmataceae bacterium]|nr:DUF1080 domain-containing protein [Gemmataceae bacterium]
MNLKILVGLLTLITLARPDVACGQEPNTLSDQDKNTGWRLLFDGRTTAGWRGFKSKTMPASWRVEDGSLLSRPRKGDSRGDIITVDQFDDFELHLQWKMTKGGNSGVIYRATEEYRNVWDSGPEYQILDNRGVVRMTSMRGSKSGSISRCSWPWSSRWAGTWPGSTRASRAAWIAAWAGWRS